MHFIITRDGDECLCPICGHLLLPGPADSAVDDGEEIDEDDADTDGYDDAAPVEWDASWLCRHVRLLDFAQASTHLFRTAELQAWWDAHDDAGWDVPEGASPPAPEGWSGSVDELNDDFVAMATLLAAERPEISHFMIAEIDAGGGPAPAWIALLGFAPEPWPDDGWV